MISGIGPDLALAFLDLKIWVLRGLFFGVKKSSFLRKKPQKTTPPKRAKNPKNGVFPPP
jgi:hypothetical protein